MSDFARIATTLAIVVLACGLAGVALLRAPRPDTIGCEQACAKRCGIAAAPQTPR